MCALCCSTATWQSKAKDYFNAKPSFYCEEHKRLGLAFGFLEAQELSEIKK
jgi:hypothetical protein